MPSLFGWLEAIPFWAGLPYPIKGALLRAFKSGLSVIVGILLVAATQGVLFPPTISPIIVIAITMILQSIDKFLRETAIANELNAAHADIPLTSTVATDALNAFNKANAVPVATPTVNTDATVVTPVPATPDPTPTTDQTSFDPPIAPDVSISDLPADTGITSDPTVFDDPPSTDSVK